MIISFFLKLAFLLNLLFIVFGIFIVLNGMGCNYEMTLSNNNSVYFVVCRGGSVTIAERDLRTSSLWITEATNLVLGDQLFFLQKTRRKISDINYAHNKFDDVQSDLLHTQAIYNFGWTMITPSYIALFKTFPNNEIIQGDFEGWLDFYHFFLSPRVLH